MNLKPCPFCGHQPESDPDSLRDSCHPVTRDKNIWVMSCNECEGGCGAQVYGHDMESSLSAWNSRPSLSAQAVGDVDDMAMHWIDRYAAGIDDVCQLDRVKDALFPSADKAVGYVGKDGSVTFYVDDFSFSRQPKAGAELFTRPDTTPPQPADGGDRVAELLEVLRRVDSRSTPHPDDDDSDRKRNLFHIASHTRAALAKFQPAGGEL